MRTALMMMQWWKVVTGPTAVTKAEEEEPPAKGLPVAQGTRRAVKIRLAPTPRDDLSLSEDEQQDAMVMGYILMHVGRSQRALCSGARTAKEVWETLKTASVGACAARLVELQRQLVQLQMQPDERVSEYFGRALELREHILEADQDIPDALFKRLLLGGLTRAFSVVACVLTDWTLDKSKTIADMLARLQAAEVDRAPRISGAALAVTAPPGAPPGNGYDRGEVVCYECEQPGHFKRDCPSRVVCEYCKKRGHEQADCRKRRAVEQQRQREEEGSGGRNAMRPQVGMVREVSPLPRCVAYAASTKACAGGSHSPGVAVGTIFVDSGASHHVTPDGSQLHEYRVIGPGDPTHIEVADATGLAVVGVGTLRLVSYVGGVCNMVDFKDVLHIPRVSHTLLSPGLMTMNDADVVMRKDYIEISRYGEMHMRGKRNSNRLYSLVGVEVMPRSAAMRRTAQQHVVSRAVQRHEGRQSDKTRSGTRSSRCTKARRALCTQRKGVPQRSAAVRPPWLGVAKGPPSQSAVQPTPRESERERAPVASARACVAAGEIVDAEAATHARATSGMRRRQRLLDAGQGPPGRRPRVKGHLPRAMAAKVCAVRGESCYVAVKALTGIGPQAASGPRGLPWLLDAGGRLAATGASDAWAAMWGYGVTRSAQQGAGGAGSRGLCG
jgi:hypothetical protein